MMHSHNRYIEDGRVSHEYLPWRQHKLGRGLGAETHHGLCHTPEDLYQSAVYGCALLSTHGNLLMLFGMVLLYSAPTIFVFRPWTTSFEC